MYSLKRNYSEVTLLRLHLKMHFIFMTTHFNILLLCLEQNVIEIK